MDKAVEDVCVVRAGRVAERVKHGEPVECRELAASGQRPVIGQGDCYGLCGRGSACEVPFFSVAILYQIADATFPGKIKGIKSPMLEIRLMVFP